MAVVNAGNDAERAFATHVRDLRKRRGWTQADLTEQLRRFGYEWHQTTIAKIELGARPVGLNEAMAIAAVFGTPLESLVRLDAGRGRSLDSRITTILQRVARLRAELDRAAQDYDQAQRAMQAAAEARDRLHDELSVAEAEVSALLGEVVADDVAPPAARASRKRKS